MAASNLCRTRIVSDHGRLLQDACRLRRVWDAQPRWNPISDIRFQHTSADSSHLPRIVQPSIWQSIIPRALRNRGDKKSTSTPKKSQNPATYFIWIYLFIGSQAIRIIGIQNDFKTFIRKADLKIGKLREAVEKLQKGEAVDVEKVLGTGDEIQENEWEEALREIENEERLWQNSKKQRRQENARRAAEEEDASPVTEPGAESRMAEEEAPAAETPRTSPGFY